MISAPELPRLVRDESKPGLLSDRLKAKQRLNVVESESEIL
ncbi:MAG: hypothetical protein WCC22_06205 [Terriglobales bacterium]